MSETLVHPGTTRPPTGETSTHLREHGFSILGHHRALVAVQRDKVVVERLLRMLEYVVELSSSALKYTPEVPRDQRPADRCRGRHREKGQSGTKMSD